MTEQEAREILLQYAYKDLIEEEYPLAQVGELFKETDTLFIFWVSIYKEGMNPEDDACPFSVNKETGEAKLYIMWDKDGHT